MEPEGKPVLWGRKPQAKSAGAGERATTTATKVLQQAPEGQRRLGGDPGLTASSGTEGFVTLVKSLPRSSPGEGGRVGLSGPPLTFQDSQLELRRLNHLQASEERPGSDSVSSLHPRMSSLSQSVLGSA